MSPANPTPVRNVRIDDDLWNAARDRADEEEVTIADVIRGFLEQYIQSGRPATSPGRLPDITISASKINDPALLMGRIGRRVWRMHIKPEHAYLESYNRTDLKRLADLLDQGPVYPRLAIALAKDAKESKWSVETRATGNTHEVICTSPDGKQVIRSLHTDGNFTEATVAFPEQNGRTVHFRNISAARKHVTSDPEDREIKE